MNVEDIINNPPKEFTEPCEACGVSEFQLGVKHEQQRIVKLLKKEIVKNVVWHHTQRMWNGGYASGKNEWNGGQDDDQKYIQAMAGYLIALIKGEQK